MSQTIAQERTRVRSLLNDETVPYAVADDKVNRTLLDLATIMGPDLGLGREWDTTFLTLSDSGSSDFTVGGTNQYSAILKLKNATTGVRMDQISNVEMEVYRAGSAVPVGPDPSLYTILEEPDGQVVIVRFHPRPNAARTIHALRELLVTGTYVDGQVLPFADDALRGLERKVAISLALQMSVVQRENRGITLELLEEWRGEMKPALDNSAARLRRQRSQVYGLGVMKWTRRGRQW